MDIAEFRIGLAAWLDAHHDELEPTFSPPGSLDDHVAQMQRVKSVLFEAGWMRWGWPERVGGLGGSPMLRTELGAALAVRDLTDPGLYSLVEVLAPTLIDFAPSELAAEFVPRLLSGEEVWCQGFSEPESGSDLASLACRAVADGPAESAGSWVVNGRKVWTSLAQYADRCVLLARTGSTESRHRGITALYVDMDSPGITVAPIEMINGVPEFAEVFFDDVVVPADRVLGEVGGGWAVAMSILPYERSSCFWQRTAYLTRRLQLVVEAAADDERTAGIVGEAFLQLHQLRARSRATQHRMAAAARWARRRRSTRCSSRLQNRGSTTPSSGSCPESWRSTTRQAARRGVRSTCTRVPRRSTAAPSRYSATSSPDGSSISAGTTD
jgi:alkylation response protein AidB-like acyl-CoA dehydrogenase